MFVNSCSAITSKIRVKFLRDSLSQTSTPSLKIKRAIPNVMRAIESAIKKIAATPANIISVALLNTVTTMEANTKLKFSIDFSSHTKIAILKTMRAKEKTMRATEIATKKTETAPAIIISGATATRDNIIPNIIFWKR